MPETAEAEDLAHLAAEYSLLSWAWSMAAAVHGLLAAAAGTVVLTLPLMREWYNEVSQGISSEPGALELDPTWFASTATGSWTVLIIAVLLAVLCGGVALRLARGSDPHRSAVATAAGHLVLVVPFFAYVGWWLITHRPISMGSSALTMVGAAFLAIGMAILWAGWWWLWQRHRRLPR